MSSSSWNSRRQGKVPLSHMMTMLTLASDSNGKTGSSRPEPKPLKRITPPRDLDVVRGAIENGGGGDCVDHQPADQEPEIGAFTSEKH